MVLWLVGSAASLTAAAPSSVTNVAPAKLFSADSTVTLDGTGTDGCIARLTAATDGIVEITLTTQGSTQRAFQLTAKAQGQLGNGATSASGFTDKTFAKCTCEHRASSGDSLLD